MFISDLGLGRGGQPSQFAPVHIANRIEASMPILQACCMIIKLFD